MVIIGGGPGGYEAALVGSQLGGDVTLIDTDGLGGSAVLTDCVPSKTLIATAEVMTEVHESGAAGPPLRGRRPRRTSETVRRTSTSRAVNRRVLAARAISSRPTSASGSHRESVDLIDPGRGRLDGPDRVIAETGRRGAVLRCRR